jgi:hypothetical protein
MNPMYLAHLERTLRAFVRLVNKLEQLENSPDSPLWQEELKEAQAVLAQARKIAFGEENG